MAKDNKPCETNLCNELGIYVLIPFSRLFDYYFVPYLFHLKFIKLRHDCHIFQPIYTTLEPLSMAYIYGMKVRKITPKFLNPMQTRQTNGYYFKSGFFPNSLLIELSNQNKAKLQKDSLEFESIANISFQVSILCY